MPTWDDAKKFRLLLAVIDSMEVSKMPSWDTVANKLGPDFTGEAVRQQYAKIKKGAAAELGAGAANGDVVPATPKSRKRGTGTPKTPKTKTPAKRKASSSDDEDMNEAESPMKKQTASRRSKSAAATKVKTEETDEEAGDAMEDDDFPDPPEGSVMDLLRETYADVVARSEEHKSIFG